ncbi:MAG: type III pantothenate kinase [Pirellulaceae bacterium]|nr:MAG: type III pantothenate kinase [Pirellulaceae bacterium]
MNQHVGVDIGNSGVKAGLLDLANRQVRQPIRLSWKSLVSGKSLGDEKDRSRAFSPREQYWPERLVKELGLEGGSTQWWVGSVNRAATAQLCAYLQDYVNAGARIELLAARDIDLGIDVEVPERVGIDRLLATYAAACEFPERPIIVVEAGTAVTVDLLRGGDHRRGVFCGGAIVPGMPLMMQMLEQGTDLLPGVNVAKQWQPPVIPAKRTEDAMLAGAFAALVGGVVRLVDEYRHRCGEDTRVVASGGDADLFAPCLPGPLTKIDHLVLRGIAWHAARRAS